MKCPFLRYVLLAWNRPQRESTPVPPPTLPPRPPQLLLPPPAVMKGNEYVCQEEFRLESRQDFSVRSWEGSFGGQGTMSRGWDCALDPIISPTGFSKRQSSSHSQLLLGSVSRVHCQHLLSSPSSSKKSFLSPWLASVALLVGHHPVHCKVAGSIPGQGTCPGFGLIPGRLSSGGSHPMFCSHINVSLPFFLSKKKKKINKNSLKNNKKSFLSSNGTMPPWKNNLNPGIFLNKQAYDNIHDSILTA
uniref:Uncharacterized protein n=1 Tax=Myotis myotis TaxID=51298 RepID=A0A7J7SR91_MYOMY|nr:hypothetical protein mMyoMyo1_009359 [Myotis myotis]